MLTLQVFLPACLRASAAACLIVMLNACSSGTGTPASADDGYDLAELPEEQAHRVIGVAFLVHGGFETFSEAALYDSTLQIFSYDQNSFVYQKVIWNPSAWPLILEAGDAPKELGKYSFELERIGGRDPAMQYTLQQLADMTAVLEGAQEELNVSFVTDYMNWIGDISHLAYPRHIYEPGVEDGTPMTYCGDPAAPWEGCDPERYNTDGTIERMLQAGVDEIVIVDLTVSGVRFFKSYDAVRMSREVIDRHNRKTGANVELRWVNDPGDLMERSYPDLPEGWTNSLGAPDNDPRVPLRDNPNPVSEDPSFALLHVEGIEQHFDPDVPLENTGVMLVNHATRKHNQLFDPKIDDTLVMNKNIRAQLLARNPGLRRSNILGAWMGIKEVNPSIEAAPPTFSQLERTRQMRGENLGYAYLYETAERFPAAEWGYLYWDVLEYLKDEGVEHIVIAFPQITVDSVLSLVELPNQIAKEVGYKTWAYMDALDYETYPDVGHPFADYWGVWVEQQCPVAGQPDAEKPCCFEMGGCADGRPYPPTRLAPLDKPRDDLDPSLAFDVSEFGHLGYSPVRGKPDKNSPVQSQYRGTWAIWTPPNTDPRVSLLLAGHVVEAVKAVEE